jgi:mycofactocin precursor
MAEKTAAVSNEDAEESNADVTEDLLVEEVSIDGMCGVY